MAPSADIPLLQHNNDLVTTKIPFSKSAITTQVHELTEDDTQPRPNTLVLHPALITRDFDALRFSAGAHAQLRSAGTSPSTPAADSESSTSSRSPAYSTSLISSPYNNPSHYLDLRTLSHESRLFALALTALAPTRPDYATAPYTSSLNFDHVLSVLRSLVHDEGYAWKETCFYVVVFRSQLRENVDQEWLYKLDFESHGEACERGGLLKYWFGKADLQGERRNLATCFWHSREDAVKGGAGPWHAKARKAGREAYESIVFETLRFTVLDGAEGWKVEDWRG